MRSFTWVGWSIGWTDGHRLPWRGGGGLIEICCSACLTPIQMRVKSNNQSAEKREGGERVFMAAVRWRKLCGKFMQMPTSITFLSHSRYVDCPRKGACTYDVCKIFGNFDPCNEKG